MDDVYMISFNNVSKPNNTICINGINFLINETFLLIASKPIPKNSKTYFEFTINSYSNVTGYHNMPIYVGIHKEPAFGVLNSDFCIGSVFYTDTKDFDIMSKYNKTALDSHTSPGKILCRTPGITDVIGVGVDYGNNLITIYSNGKPFYTITPSLFKINEEEDFYFCIWGNVKCSLKGYINFGKSGVLYLPSGYSSLYGEYYRQSASIDNISGSITVNDITHEKESSAISGIIIVTNTLKGDGSLTLVSKTATITDRFEYTLPTITSNNYLVDGGNVFCNLPIPYSQKIYVELYVKDGVLSDDSIIGIPASIGISGSINEITTKSMRMPLYHKQWHNYTYTEVSNSNPNVTQISDVDTSIPNVQGKLIGLLFNLAENEITVLVDKVELYTVKATSLDFSKPNTLAYLFLHDEGAYKNSITGSFNLGEYDFMDDIPDGYMSLYQYYNLFYLIESPPKYINGTITVTPYIVPKADYLSGSIIVPEDPDPTDESGTILNRLMKTYNGVTDVEAHETTDTSLNYLVYLIKNNNNGYTIDD